MDHCQGESGKRKNAAFALKSFVLKILTSNPLGLKILRTLFAEPAPGAALRGWGRGEGIQPSEVFPKLNSPKHSPKHQLQKFFRADFDKISEAQTPHFRFAIRKIAMRRIALYRVAPNVPNWQLITGN